MKIFCKHLFVLAVIICCIAGIAISAHAEEVIASGTCGDNLTWTLDDEGTLTISGTGSMDNYSSDDWDDWDTVSCPWSNHQAQIKNVKITDGVTSIGDSAFESCDNLTNITISNVVTSIGDFAFYGCSSLTSITIPDSICSIGCNAFGGCTGLNGVYITDLAAWCQIYIENDVHQIGGYHTTPFSNPLYEAENLYLNGELVTDLIIPENITTIKMYSFANCNSLRSVTIPDSVQYIKEGAFSGCDNLEKIYFCGSAPRIQDTIFEEGWDELDSIYVAGAFEYVKAIAYYYAANDTWTNPVKLNYGGTITWVACDEKTSPDGLKYIITNNQVTITGYTGNATALAIPSVIEGLPIVSIGGYAFANCSSLTNITIPNSVTAIDDKAFYNCTSLTNITIPISVTSIGDTAFYNCTSLKHVAYTGTQSQWNNISIYSYNTYLKNATRHYETQFQNIDNCVGTGVYCPVCEQYLTYEPYENGVHNYGEWMVTIPATLTTTGQKEQTCTLCGDTNIEILDMLVGNVHKWNITLKDDYAVNFYLQISESIQHTTKVRLTIGTDIVTYNISDLQKSEDGYFQLTANISAAQMNDFITVMVIYGRDICCNNTYTTRQYCDEILDNPEHSTYHALVREMLNYGAMAQMYFDYDTEYLANEGITGVANANIPESVKELTVSDKIGSIDFYGASLVYRDRIAVRYYFTGDVTGCAFKANGNTYTPAEKDGMHYVEIPEILPQNLDQQIALIATDADGNTLTVTYGPMNYIVRMNVKGNENLQNLLKALYNYHLAAKQLNRSAA